MYYAYAYTSCMPQEKSAAAACTRYESAMFQKMCFLNAFSRLVGNKKKKERRLVKKCLIQTINNFLIQHASGRNAFQKEKKKMCFSIRKRLRKFPTNLVVVLLDDLVFEPLKTRLLSIIYTSIFELQGRSNLCCNFLLFRQIP